MSGYGEGVVSVRRVWMHIAAKNNGKRSNELRHHYQVSIVNEAMEEKQNKSVPGSGERRDGFVDSDKKKQICVKSVMLCWIASKKKEGEVKLRM